MKVAISGDARRPTPGQETNIRWLYDLISHQVAWALSDNTKWNAPSILLSDEILDIDQWVKTYGTNLHSWHHKMVSEKKIDLLIGFELPSEAQLLPIPVIDIIQHPARFCDDIVFGIRLWNYPNRIPYEISSGWYFDEHLLTMNANLVKACFEHKPRIHLPKGSVVVFGQTDIDRSLIQDGKILKLKDFEKELSEIKEKNKYCFFKKHPASSNQALTAWMQNLGYEVIDQNVYELLSHPNLKEVIGISSSVLHEAKWFGKPARFFKREYAIQHAPVLPSVFLSRQFWAEILKPSPKKLPYQERHIWSQNKIRKTCNAWQGYEIFKDK